MGQRVIAMKKSSDSFGESRPRDTKESVRFINCSIDQSEELAEREKYRRPNRGGQQTVKPFEKTVRCANDQTVQ